MNTKKFNNQLSKLNAVFSTLSEESSISALEKELLKKYVVNLFDALMDGKEEARPSGKKSDLPVKGKEEKKKIVEEEKLIKKQSPQVAHAEIVKKEEIKAEPKAEKIEPQVSKEEVKVEVKSPVVDTPKPKPVVIRESYKIPSELLEIFAEENATELSDKLGLSKVDDIRKSMGINEKIFTIKELFGGDQDKFNSILTKIDACKNYKEATELLGKTVAKEEKWTEEGKIKKAKQFVKLVQRKFQ